MVKFLISGLFLILSSVPVYAQLKYTDAREFPLYGKITDKTLTRYERLPADLEKVTRSAVWYQGRCSSGLFIRFRSNASIIGVKWSLLRNKEMNHMAYVGIKGLDLYALVDGKWSYARPARPVGKDNEAVIIRNMDGAEREYMLYLPLYDQVTHLEIGVDSAAYVKQPLLNIPDTKIKPVIWYGTSIDMGGCASRPGMCLTSILSRRLNREIINLGFSGNALYDYEIAEIMGDKDAALYVINNLPNVSAAMVHDKAEKFYRILRKKAPRTPVLFIEHPIYPYLNLDRKDHDHIYDMNAELKCVYKKLKADGEKNIYYLKGEGLIDVDTESTVDGEHFTDLGFFRMSEAVYPILQKILKRSSR